MPDVPLFEDIREAHSRIKKYIHRTPVLTSESLNNISGTQLYFKCENFQKTGAFKYRGATNAVLNLSEDNRSFGVATHSSGNHAAALALAAKTNGIKCYVVMPENAPKVKVDAVKNYGAEITFCKPGLQYREETLNKLIAKNKATFIHPYNFHDVICGQGTAALEFAEDIPDLDVILAPVGGGGLLSGTAISAKTLNPRIKIFGAEPANADDACRSFHSGILVPSVNPNTIADGLLTSLGELTFEIIRRNVNDIFTVSEASIIRALKLIWQRMKIVVEPSSAVPLAVVLENGHQFQYLKTGIILSGGNADLSLLPFN